MIIMFVRDEDPVQTLRTHSDGFKSVRDLTGTEPGVHEKPALACGNQRTIACTPAAEGRQTEHRLSKAYSRTDANHIPKEQRIRWSRTSQGIGKPRESEVPPGAPRKKNLAFQVVPLEFRGA